MDFKRFIITTGLASTLVLTACNSADEDTKTEDKTEEVSKEADTSEVSVGEEVELSFEGEYGTYDFSKFETLEIPATDEAKSAAKEAGEEEPGPTKVVVAEFEYTNKSTIPTSASEAFGLDFAVRQVSEEGVNPTDNMTLDVPEDSEYADMIADSSETMIKEGEKVKAFAAYGPIDDELETHLQSRDGMESEAFDVLIKTK
ncbi:hypothetical protein GCM10007358_00440 [Phocicoccus schoeneichii]|uniref:DUF5067 domain-containing protein n=1 Tax=Phocicoccus schoeneichii TaxID=1812261 RepID=A0A6V7RLI8_9BACL|nr:DUF5067 domain-containing protein [Jeotgalicoccus schoeneichii]GGH46283.1 hypothetical protein GCM10007358_00440 [Jeotgalicoccus schoeneichii]CAD2078376.1 hypothetical protein JEOSCH030_01508 [Jeotgalicoccus schoeneichii]